MMTKVLKVLSVGISVVAILHGLVTNKIVSEKYAYSLKLYVHCIVYFRCRFEFQEGY